MLQKILEIYKQGVVFLMRKMSNFHLNKTTILSTFVIILVLFGLIISSFGKDSSDVSWALRIGNDYVGIREFDDMYRNFIRSKRLVGDDIELKKKFVSQLALEKSMELELKNYGFRIDDDLLIEIIKNDDMFKENGAFSPILFKNFLENQYITEREYMRAMRSNLVSDVVTSGMASVITSDDLTAEMIAKSREELRKGDIYIMDPKNIKISSAPSANTLYEFYNKNRNLFRKKKEKAIKIINMKDIYGKIDYQANEAAVDNMRSSFPGMKMGDAKRMFENAYKCKMIENLLKDIQSYNRERFENLAMAYDVSILEKNFTLGDDKLSGYVDRIATNSIGLGRYGEQCYEVNMIFAESEKPVEYLSFDEARANVLKEYLKHEQGRLTDEMVNNWNSGVELKNNTYIEQLNILRKNGFAKNENFAYKRADQNINPEILEAIFTPNQESFSRVVRIGDVYKVAFISHILPVNAAQRDFALKVAESIHNEKKTDMYYLYYMYLQDKYDIEINGNYFKTYVIK